MRCHGDTLEAQMRPGCGGFSKWVMARLNILQRQFTKLRYQIQRKIHLSDDDDDRHDFEKPFTHLNHDTQGGVSKFMAAKTDASYRKFVLCSSNPVAAVLILTALWLCLYSGSLVGGDLRAVMGQLGRIGAFFFSAIACFLAAVYVAVFSPSIPGRMRAFLLVVIIGSWNLMFLYDHGGSLSHHGGYNMLLFILIVIPAIVVAGVEYGLWRMVGGRKLLALHLPIFIGGGMAATIALHKSNQVWDQGFRGERMLPLKNQAAICTPVNRGLPWVDMLPKGAQNFWAGAMTCGNSHQKAAKDLDFHVNFSMEGALSISCNAATGLTYTPIPSTLNWPKADKQVEESYEGKVHRPMNKNVMDKIREAGEVPYKGFQPVLLPPGIEAAIVRCGAVEKLVTRVRPNPKALSRTSPVKDHTVALNAKSYPKLDVVILFLDATSRRGFHRRLRRTVSALEEVDAKGLTRLYQFFRYNVMAFCTEQNSRAMFQGMSEARRDSWVSPLWEDFARSGWVTLHTADLCFDLNTAHMNRMSRDGRLCFDHELLSPFCHSDFFAEDSNPWGNFKGPYSITARCLKGQQVHEHELQYLQSFQTAYPDRAKFSLAWIMEGHEGTTEVLRLLDDGLAAFVKNLSEHDWNRTALIIAADHGLHMGLNFGLTQNGAVEHKNPMLAVLLPPWFADQESRHALMTKNQQRLVTGLDLHRTLQGIRLAGSRDMEWVDEAEEYRSKSGIDMLHHEVSESRTCKDAEIPGQWCQCL